MNMLEKVKLTGQFIGDYQVKGLVNLIKYFYDLKLKPACLLARPLVLQLEVTSQCNLHCPMCEHAFDTLQRAPLNFHQFKEIIDQLPFLKNLVLQGLGEPLLTPDLIKMIKEAKARNIRVGFTSNATLLNQDKAKEIINSGLDWLYISLDALDKKLYEEIRKGAIYEEVIANIKNFIKLKGQNKPEVNFWTLIMEKNLKEIPKIVHWAGELGLRRVVVQSLHNWGIEDFKKNIQQLRVNDQQKIKALKTAFKKYKGKVKIEMYLASKSKKDYCDWPWRALYITCDGYLTPCCMQGSDPRVINFGNVFQESIKNILNNQTYQQFRKRLTNPRDLPKICRDCPAYCQVRKIIN